MRLTEHLNLSEVQNVSGLHHLDVISLYTVTIHAVDSVSGNVTDSAALVRPCEDLSSVDFVGTTPVHSVVDNDQVDPILLLEANCPECWFVVLLSRRLCVRHRSERNMFSEFFVFAE